MNMALAMMLTTNSIQNPSAIPQGISDDAAARRDHNNHSMGAGPVGEMRNEGICEARIQTPTDRIRLISAASRPRNASHAGQNGR